MVTNQLFAYIQNQGLSKEEVKQFFSQPFYDIYAKTEDAIPVAIFNNDHLSALEAVVKYLKEEKEYRFVKIGRLLHRSSKTIWATWNKAIKKMPDRFMVGQSAFFIPLSRFHDRNHSPLEVVVGYLKDECQQSYHQIAVLLHRNDRTIWTTYHNLQKKMKHKK